MNLEKYHDLAVYILHLAEVQKKENRDYSIVEYNFLITVAAAIEELIMKVKDCRAIKE